MMKEIQNRANYT